MALTAAREVELGMLEARIAGLMLLIRTRGRRSRHWDAAWADLRSARRRGDRVLDAAMDGA